ncbi:MAG: ParB N-terminal domain-containing protein, partial [Chloroflexi bacterium]|nr:ParB N-terminal domain-containing protein [Chloroflexota bacterium]
ARERWTRIGMLMMMGEPLPAVELIQVGDEYYVRDGHHRISAARALGYRHIDAVVTAWQPA